MNQPYVKQYDELTGELLNPIKGVYTHKFPNRRARRNRPTRFRGNSKGISLTITDSKPSVKFYRFLQILPGGKQLEHYIPAK
jgi:hypothetical protein